MAKSSVNMADAVGTSLIPKQRIYDPRKRAATIHAGATRGRPLCDSEPDFPVCVTQVSLHEIGHAHDAIGQV